MGTQHNGPPPARLNKASYSQYVIVRQRLDELGYNAYLSNDSVPLVEKLLNDLVRYKDCCSKHHVKDVLSHRTTAVGTQSTYPDHLGDLSESAHLSCNERQLLKSTGYNQTLEAIKIENAQLHEQVADLKFVLDQNATLIQKLKKENDAKSILILQLQNGGRNNSRGGASVQASIEKNGDLPGANLSKIQSLYKRILSASDNPAIVDWVKTAEAKIASLERELENTNRALDVSQQMCEHYQKQNLECENKLIQQNKTNSNRSSQNYALMKSRMEQKERENKELQAQLSEAVRKQHEAMSRAIMLAGDRSNNNRPTVTTSAKSTAAAEKRVIGLESERGVLKQMLTATQKERDELMKEVHRLHSQESALMKEIRTLVTENPGNKTTSRSGKAVRFQAAEESPADPDSGVDSAASNINVDGAGRNRENWLKRLTEQRQLYYDNVHQLLNFMKNRQELPLTCGAQQQQRPSPQPNQQELLQQQPNQNQLQPPTRFSPSPVVHLNLGSGQPLTEPSSARSFQPSSHGSGASVTPSQPSYSSHVHQPILAPPSGNFMSVAPLQFYNHGQGPYLPQPNMAQPVPLLPQTQPSNPHPSVYQPQMQPNVEQHSDPFYQQYHNQLVRTQFTNQQSNSGFQYTSLTPAQQLQSIAHERTTNQTSGTQTTPISTSPPRYRSTSTSTGLKDRSMQTERSSNTVTPPVSYRPSSNELEKLPSQLQAFIQKSSEEHNSLKEENAELRIRADELEEKKQDMEELWRRREQNLEAQLEKQSEIANAKIKALERDLLFERNKLQQLQLDIADADGNSASLTRKYVERSAELDRAREHCTELEEKITSFEEQVAKLQTQIRNLKGLHSSDEVEQRQLKDEIESRNSRITALEKQISTKQEAFVTLQAELDSANTKLKVMERELLLERTKLSQLRLDIDNADGNVATLTKTIMDKSSQLDSSRQRCGELELQVVQLEDQVGGLQGQLRSMQIQRAQSSTEQRQLLDEADASKARISQLEKQLATKQETVTVLQASVTTYETKIRQLESLGGDQQSTADLHRRQNQRLTSELDQAKLDNTSLLQENERLVASLATLRVDLERERNEVEDLRREIQSYVSHVRQVESVLARKDEERDSLLKQFQLLANESSSFDAEREQMERTVRSHQQQTSSLQTELSNVRRRLGELEQLYAQQRSSGAEAQLQADDLMRRLGVLERDLRDARDDKMRLEQQLSAANDLQTRLEKQLERLRTEAAQADSTSHQMEAETTRLQDDLHILEQRLSKEREGVRSLESIVSILRQERAQQENQLRSMSQDLTRLQQREILLQEELANMKAELCSNEGKCGDLTRENQRLKQEILQERFEREKNRQEYKRIGTAVSITGSSHPPSFNVSPAPMASATGGSTHNLSVVTSGTTGGSSGPGSVAGGSQAGSASNGSPRKQRQTVASRFANTTTQT